MVLKLLYKAKVNNAGLACYAETQQVLMYEGLIQSFLDELEEFTTLICTEPGCEINHARAEIPKLHFHRKDFVDDFKEMTIPRSEVFDQRAAEVSFIVHFIE